MKKFLKTLHLLFLIIFIISLFPTAYFAYINYFPREFILNSNNFQQEINFPSWRDSEYCNLGFYFDENENLSKKQITDLQEKYINLISIYSLTNSQNIDLNKSDTYINELFYFRVDNCKTQKQTIIVQVDENIFNEIDHNLTLKVLADESDLLNLATIFMVSVVSFFVWAFFFLIYAIFSFVADRKV